METAEVILDNKEQLVILVVSTIVGFLANKGTESTLTKFYTKRKLSS